MKLAKRISAVAAISATTMLLSPATASCVSDLDTGIYTISNDGIPRRVLVRSGYSINMHSSYCEYPIGESEVKGGFPREGGLLGIGGEVNKRVYTSFASSHSSIRVHNGIMDAKMEGLDMYDHFTKPARIGSDKVMAEIRIEKDRLVKVQLTEASLDNRKGRRD